MTPDGARCRELFGSARVATLATRRADGGTDLVPIVFALLPADVIVTAVDHKPKRTTELGRLANVGADPRVALLADHYDDDRWDRLWWVRAHGEAAVLSDGEERDRAVAALVARYRQYRERPPAHAVLAIRVRSWRGWVAAAG